MPDLSFKYRRGSDLPRRTFVVDVTVNGAPGLQLTVTAPDYTVAETLVRVPLNSNAGVESFSLDMVREVRTDGWNPERGDYSAVVVTVPFEYRPVVNYR
jgi:hypothetical protein